MDLTENDWYIIIGIVAIYLIWKYVTTHKDNHGRIQDQSVSVSNVIKCLLEFKAESDPSLKEGYTEKSIQKQLKKHLLETFVHVTDEYGIEGINSTKIDFDIGNGKVGIEIKLAREIFKTSNLHRLVGQIEDYIKYKYKSDNLIVAIIGETYHTNERSQLKIIQEKVVSKGAKICFLKIME